ncbi:MAG: DUF4340 domain-containing protein [Defluviitaleaceae bacterium]|nr:DUF4340 domain-containing protein [Defluviitaleaceae bacterium]
MSGKSQRIFTLTISAIVIALLAGLYFWQIRDIGEEEEIERPLPISISLINRAEEEVMEIAFTAGGERTYMRPFTDEAGRLQWAYSGAADYIIDTFRTRDKARPAWLFAAVEIAHENADGVNLSDFGLSPPLLTIEPTFSDGTGHIIKLGSLTADLQHSFLMIDNEPAIYLITAVLAERLKFTSADMLDLSIPFIDIHEADYIRLAERDTAPIVLGLRGEDAEVSPLAGLVPDIGGEHLVMHEPTSGLLLSTSRLMEYVIHPMSQLRLFDGVADVHPEDLSPFGLDNPILEFQFRTPAMELHLFFGNVFTRDGIEFIYVKVADRPHVFYAEAFHAQALFGINPMSVVDRFLALIPIADTESITINSPGFSPDSFRLLMNHIHETHDLDSPTINGFVIEESDFRTAFRIIISLLADAEIDPFSPTSPPETTITFHRINNPDTQLRLYNYNATFLAASIDGDAPRFITSRRAVDWMLEHLAGLN